MKSEVHLDAVKRELTGKKVKTLRNDGQLPAVIYGAGIEPTPIVLNRLVATRMLRGVSASTLVRIDLDGAEHTTIVRERQYDRIKREMIHVDFLAVAMNVLLKANVPIRLVGVSPAVADFNAMIFAMTESLEVEALPRNMPEEIEIDISVLKSLGDTLTLADLEMGADVNILDPLDTVIASAISGISEQEEEEEEAADEELEGGVEPEVIEKGKRDEDEEDED